MNLGKLSETVILIDTEFLGERIAHNLNFYQNLYPDKIFRQINLGDLLYKFALNARVQESGHKVDVLFAYRLGYSSLYHCEPNDVFDFIDTNDVSMETDIGTFAIRSFFADEDETCSEHFVNMLQMVYSSSSVSRIIMVADNADLAFEVEMMYEQREKSLFMLKKYHDSDITVPIQYVKIDFPIAYSLGLNKSEV